MTYAWPAPLVPYATADRKKLVFSAEPPSNWLPFYSGALRAAGIFAFVAALGLSGAIADGPISHRFIALGAVALAFSPAALGFLYTRVGRVEIERTEVMWSVVHRFGWFSRRVELYPTNVYAARAKRWAGEMGPHLNGWFVSVDLRDGRAAVVARGLNLDEDVVTAIAQMLGGA